MPQISLHTPIGGLTVSEENGAIVAVDWGWGRDQDNTLLLVRAREQIHEYFDGERRSFALPFHLSGTAYQRRIWTALSSIPYGNTRTYTEIARIAGGTAQSVGRAKRSNPMPILIPCHRVIREFDIGSYSATYEVMIKRHLLKLEMHST